MWTYGKHIYSIYIFIELLFLLLQVTDSPYVVASMGIMTRMGSPVLQKLVDGEEFVRCQHSVGRPLPLTGKRSHSGLPETSSQSGHSRTRSHSGLPWTKSHSGLTGTRSKYFSLVHCCNTICPSMISFHECVFLNNSYT